MRTHFCAKPAIWASSALLLLALLGTALAQDEPAPPDTPPMPTAAEEPEADAYDLALGQEQIAAKYRRFEEVLLRIAELTEESDPDRAALLRRVVAQSKEHLIGLQFDRLVELLRSERLPGAVRQQADLQADLEALLDLLLSEDRKKKLAEEKERVKKWLAEVNQLIKRQRAIQGATETGDNNERTAKRQGDLADQTGELSDQMRDASEAAAAEAGDAGQSDAPSSDAGSDEPESSAENESADEPDPAEDEPGDSKPEPSESGSPEPSDGDSSESGSPSDGQSQSDSSPQPGQSGQGSESQPNPAQQRLEAAQQRMQRAQQRLEDAQRENAIEEQEAALRELEQAKAELEEILRQLREEELGRTLAMLESRFRQMLDQQVTIYEDTKRLDAVPDDQWARADDIQAGRLGRQESELVLEAEGVLLLLSEDGTAVAMPEAVRQMRDDMQHTASRLASSKVGTITQAIEEDIIAALEEMIAAVQKAQQELEERQNQPAQQGEPSDPPLIDQLAELRMIRALQMRVNNRTARYAELIDGEQAVDVEILEALNDLAEREQRIWRVTRDIVVGKTEGP